MAPIKPSSFPKEEDRCKAWIKAANNPKLDDLSAAYLYKHAVLCGDHFQDWCFMNTQSRKRLVHNAVPASSKPLPKKVVPSINLPPPESEVSCVIKSELKELLTAPVPTKAPSLNLSTPLKLVSSPVLQKQIPINSTIKNPGSVVTCVTKSEVEELPTSPEPAEELNLSKPPKLIQSPLLPYQIPIDVTVKTSGLAGSCVVKSELKGHLITPTSTKAPLHNISKLPTNSASQEVKISKLPTNSASQKVKISKLPTNSASQEVIISEMPSNSVSQEVIISEMPSNSTSQVVKISKMPANSTFQKVKISKLPTNSTFQEVKISKLSTNSAFQKVKISEMPANSTFQKVKISNLSTNSAFQKVKFSKLPTKSASQEANCSSSNYQSPKNYTPREKELAKQVRQLREKLRYVNKKFELYKKKHPPKQPLKDILAAQGVSEELSNFIERQVSLDQCKKAKRFTECDKAQALEIFCESEEAYNALKDVLILPSKRTLQRFVSTKPSTKNNEISVKEISKNENLSSDERFDLV